MADVRHFNVATHWPDDEKIKLIEAMPDGDTILVIWFKILAWAGRENDENGIVTLPTVMTDEAVATVVGRPAMVTRLALETFTKLGMINRNENHLQIIKWPNHQYMDGLAKIREQTRKRVQEFRERQKQPLLPEAKSNDVTLPVTHSNVSVTNKGEGKGKEIKEEGTIKYPSNYISGGGEGIDSNSAMKNPTPPPETIDKFKSNRNVTLKKLQAEIINQMMSAFPKCFGREPDFKELAQLRDLSQELANYQCPATLAYQAIREASKSNKHRLSYVRAIALAWLGIGKEKSNEPVD